MEGAHKFAEVKNSDTGEVVCQMFHASNALSDGADGLSRALYSLTELLVRGGLAERCGGGMGGEFGYGADFENDVFMMHPFCWCEEDDCKWCSDRAPNFLHKKSGIGIRWYKWIGRDMELEPKETTGEQLNLAMREVFDSIPSDIKAKAQAEHNRDNSPEALAEQKACMAALFKLLSNPEKYGAPKQKANCNVCGREYEYCEWATIICGPCPECCTKRFERIAKGE